LTPSSIVVVVLQRMTKKKTKKLMKLLTTTMTMMKGTEMMTWKMKSIHQCAMAAEPKVVEGYDFPNRNRCETLPMTKMLLLLTMIPRLRRRQEKSRCPNPDRCDDPRHCCHPLLVDDRDHHQARVTRRSHPCRRRQAAVSCWHALIHLCHLMRNMTMSKMTVTMISFSSVATYRCCLEWKQRALEPGRWYEAAGIR
jgi:hypothetical protein